MKESGTGLLGEKRFAVRPVIGDGNPWIAEFALSYDGVPSCTERITEFGGGKVVSETRYVDGRFDPGPSWTHLVEPSQ